MGKKGENLILQKNDKLAIKGEIMDTKDFISM